MAPDMRHAIRETTEILFGASFGLIAGFSIAEVQAVIGVLVSFATLIWIVLRICKLVRPDKFTKGKEENE